MSHQRLDKKMVNYSIPYIDKVRYLSHGTYMYLVQLSAI
jgi:hypothetical protein